MLKAKEGEPKPQKKMLEIQTDLPHEQGTPTPVANIHCQLYPSALVAKVNTALELGHDGGWLLWYPRCDQ